MRALRPADRRTIVALAVVTLLSPAATGLVPVDGPDLPVDVATPAVAPAGEGGGDHEEHLPIKIDGDEDFASPNSGVRNPEAEGTADDPYVISGWDLEPMRVSTIPIDTPAFGEKCKPAPGPTPTSGWILAIFHALEIKNTDAHVVIQDNIIHPYDGEDLSESPVGQIDSKYMIPILLHNADNVRIESNRIHGFHDGAELFRGICTKDTENLEIVGNTVEQTTYTGVELEDAPKAEVAGNIIRHSRGWDDPGASPTDGLAVTTSPQTTITNNTVTDHDVDAIALYGSDRVLVDNNTATRSMYGLRTGGDDGTVTYNNIYNNTFRGIRLGGAHDLHAHRNNIHNNTNYGLDAEDFEWAKVHAQHNWWGCPDGPRSSNTDCDDIDEDFNGEVNASAYESSRIAVAGPG